MVCDKIISPTCPTSIPTKPQTPSTAEPVQSICMLQHVGLDIGLFSIFHPIQRQHARDIIMPRWFCAPSPSSIFNNNYNHCARLMLQTRDALQRWNEGKKREDKRQHRLLIDHWLNSSFNIHRRRRASVNKPKTKPNTKSKIIQRKTKARTAMCRKSG